MMNLILPAVALVLETSSFFTVLLNESGNGVFALLILKHALASVIFASFVWSRLPETFRNPRRQVMLLLFNFSFFIPLVGLAGLLAAVRLSGYRRHPVAAQPFAHVSVPEFVPPLREPDRTFNQAGIKSRLEHSSIPTPQRLQSLLALQAVPPHVSSPLLHHMLGDASDDIRLVAYGLLDGREKKITTEINRELANLKMAEGSGLRLMAERHLAELYWELAYSGLAQGDLRTHALDQAFAFTDAALLLAPEETGLWFLKGRILHEMKRSKEAYQILQHAMEIGLPESRAMPYIVEIAFEHGDYQTVRTLLERISASQVTSIMKGVIAFWTRGLDKNVIAGKGEGT
jgi:hypothetical protein